MKDLSSRAAELFKEGFSCSESVVRAAQELNYINKDINIEVLTQAASPFSGAMGGSGCLCGAIVGSQMTLGLILGRTAPDNDPHSIKQLANQLINNFKEKRKATCCKVLTAKHSDPISRRQNCAEIVRETAEILQKITDSKI